VNGNAPDILGVAGITTTNVNFSAVGSATGFTLSGTSGNNLAFGTNLLLGPLADNGGQTLTMMPASGSPLINAGNNTLTHSSLSTDQRGPGFFRIHGSIVDIGAVEREILPLTVLSSNFNFLIGPRSLRFAFSHDVSASLGVEDLVVEQLGVGVVAGVTFGAYEPLSDTATFVLPSVLPDADYRVRLLSSGVTDSFSRMLGSDYTLDFFVLAGDANRDRKVDVGDLGQRPPHAGRSARQPAKCPRRGRQVEAMAASGHCNR
jgi:hypothetical protein